MWHVARWYGVYWRVNSLPSPSPYTDLSVVLRGVRDAMGGWCARGALAHGLALILWSRLSMLCTRMEGLAGRFLAGGVRRRVAVARAGSAAAGDGLGDGVRRGAGGGARAWPGHFAWLVRRVGWQAAGFGCQLRAVLQTPEMVALLEASPQAGRMLRPICRMLAVETALLRLPPRLRVARVAVVGDVVAGAISTPRKARGRAVVEPWRIKLPRGVLAAARRQGFGRIPSDKG